MSVRLPSRSGLVVIMVVISIRIVNTNIEPFYVYIEQVVYADLPDE